MDILDAIIVGRVAERLLITVFGGLSLVLGWYLFLKGIVNPSSADAAMGAMKIRLSRVAPGTFFAIFGAGLLVNSTLSTLHYESTSPGIADLIRLQKEAKPSATSPEQPATSGATSTQASAVTQPPAAVGAVVTASLNYASPPQIEQRTISRAINTLGNFPISKCEPAVSPYSVGLFNRARTTLRSYQDFILAQNFTTAELADWSLNRDRYVNPAGNLTEDDRRRLSKVAGWAIETLESER